MNCREENLDLVSVNPISRQEYLVPKDLDDKDKINEFLKRNEEKKIIVVQGLGFVGAAMALVCANANDSAYAVIGVDLPTTDSYWKIAGINSGVCPVVSGDTKIKELFDNATEQGNLYATCDPFSYSVADVVIVDINLDVEKKSDKAGNILDYSVDTTPLERSAALIGKNCKEDVLVLVETTVPPGSCEKIYKVILTAELEKRGLPVDRLAIGHSYERVMPGPGYIDSIVNFYRVYSGVDSSSADRTESFLKTVINTGNYPLTRLASTVATESAKILENSYRAMNIAFVEEWSRFAEEAGYNLYEVIDAIRLRPTHKNLMYPGLGVGGYCLTKDPLLASWAKRENFNSMEGLVKSVESVERNDKMPHNVYTEITKFFGSNVCGMKVLLLGVSYRSEVADTRYSPVEVLYRSMNRDGASVFLHDYYVSYWEECERPVETDLEKLLHRIYDAVVVSTSHSGYRDNKLLIDWLHNQSDVFVYDSVGALSQASLDQISINNSIKVVGRGDL